MEVEKMLIIGSLLLFLSIGSSKLSSKLGIPTLLFFLMIGALLNKYWDKIPGFPSMSSLHENMVIARNLGIITLILVLFAGGLETDFQHIRPILWSGILLSTVGAFVTALVVGLFLQWATADNFGLRLSEGVLVGAIVASTDAAAVFSILRARNIKLKANLGELLELESGSNDVMVFFLMTFLLELLNPLEVNGVVQEVSAFKVIPMFFQEMVIGGLGGLCMGYAMMYVINTINLSYPALYPALTLSLLFLTYGGVNSLHGSGFLAVYISGMILGSHDLIHKKSLIRFYKGIGWLMQILMFVALGFVVVLKELKGVADLGIKLALVLMLIARPLSVFLSLAFSKLQVKHKLFVSWVGLRGAVPIVFGMYLYKDKLPERKELLFHLIYFVVILSVLLQGATLYPLAKWLKLENKVVAARKQKEEKQRSDIIRREFRHLEVPPGSPANAKAIVQLGLPESVYIAVIHRGKKQYLWPRGDTKVQAGDRLIVMFDTKKDLKELKACFGLR